MQIPIKPGDQVFIRGDKGAGKSVLCMALAGDQSLVVLDPKGEEEWLNYAAAHDMAVTRDPADVRRHRRVLVLVDQLWLDDREGWKTGRGEGWQWTQVLDNVWNRRNTIVVFEEAIQTLPSSGANPRARRILTQGRIPGLTTLIPIQVTNWVDTLGPKLAGHYISFRCSDEEELTNIRRARSCDASVLKTLGEHDFAYHARGAQQWIVCRALPKSLVDELTKKVVRMKKGVANGADRAQQRVSEPA